MEYDAAASETQTLEKDDTACLNLSKLSRGRSRTPAVGGEWPIGLNVALTLGF